MVCMNDMVLGMTKKPVLDGTRYPNPDRGWGIPEFNLLTGDGARDVDTPQTRPQPRVFNNNFLYIVYIDV